MAAFGVDKVEYADTLISEAIDKIFEDKELRDFTKVKNHLHQILRLHIEKTDEYLAREAQVRLCEIVSAYNSEEFFLTPYEITHTNTSEDFRRFMNKLIKNCYDKLTISDLI